MSDPRVLWATDAWRDDAVAWADHQLAAHGLERTGIVEQPFLRPWSTVLSMPATGGTVWMKAAGAGTAFEVGLCELLHRVVPDRVLPPLGIDVEAGWLLLPDGGPVLREQWSGQAQVDVLIEVVPQYAQLQLDLAPHVDELLALGVTDMRAARMLERFDEAVSAAQVHVTARGKAGDQAALDRVVGLRGTFGDACRRLSGAPGAASLDHNDLHGGNVFVVGESGARQSRFFDWGDAVVAHPFASALVLRSVVRYLLEPDPADAMVQRVVEAYLEPFSDLAPRAELLETVDLACEVGKVARSLVWGRALAQLPPGDDNHDIATPFAWLLELLDGPLATEA